MTECPAKPTPHAFVSPYFSHLAVAPEAKNRYNTLIKFVPDYYEE